MMTTMMTAPKLDTPLVESQRLLVEDNKKKEKLKLPPTLLILFSLTSTTCILLLFREIPWSMELMAPPNNNNNNGITFQTGSSTTASHSATAAAVRSQCSAKTIVQKAYNKAYKPFVDHCVATEVFRERRQNRHNVSNVVITLTKYEEQCFVNYRNGEDAVTATTTTNNTTRTTPPTTRPPLPPWWFEKMIHPAGGADGNKRIFSRMYHHIWFDHPKFRFCQIEKVASNSWSKILEKCARDPINITDDDPTIPNPRGGLGWTSDTADFPRVVFLRDPLERFLSGYIDKCIKPFRRREGHCQPDFAYDMRVGLSKQQAMESYLSTLPLDWNVHFIPQAFYCGGLFGGMLEQEFDFVGSMDTKNFKADLLRLTQTYPGPLMDYYVRDEFSFLKDNATNFRETLTAGHATGSSQRVLEYFNPESIRMALQYFAIDYTTLNLTIPTWVQDILDDDCKLRFG